jgi:hypothetical protein
MRVERYCGIFVAASVATSGDLTVVQTDRGGRHKVVPAHLLTRRADDRVYRAAVEPPVSDGRPGPSPSLALAAAARAVRYRRERPGDCLGVCTWPDRMSIPQMR